MKRKVVSVIMLILLFVSVLILTFNTQPVRAGLPVRNIDTGEDFAKIQEAIDDPDTLNGHTILVDAGTYYEHVVVNKTLSLIGENRETTTIEGNGTGTVVYVFADNVNISRFTIRNSGPLSNDGGIYLGNSQGCSIDGNEICAESMGIIVSGSSENRLASNRIERGFNPEWYGIHLINSSGNMIVGNVQEDGEVGIVLNEGSCDNNISYNQIGYNIQLGILLSGSHNNTVRNNKVGLCFSSRVMGLYESNGNIIYHNHFIGYTVDQPPLTPPVAITKSFDNIWDDGYPSGGNYWTDYDGSDPWAYYNGSDLYSGPYQNKTGSDGIGDTPYVINQDNIDHYPLMKPYGGPHDIGIRDVTTSETIVYQGLHINATIINYGIYPENFNVTAYANTTLIATFENIILPSRNSTTITFTWNTTGFAKGKYTISANATTVPGEADTADNNKTDGWVMVTILGDINGDRIIDVVDLTIASLALWSKPGDPEWNPNADLNEDDIIDIVDLTIVTIHLWETW